LSKVGTVQDIVISESVAPARFTQDDVSLQAYSDGWITLWTDDRLGSEKVFLQLIDSQGQLSGTNQLIAGSASGTNYVDAKLRVDSQGRLHVYYRDRNEGLIIGARFASDLSIDLAAFLVNDTSFESFAGPFDFDIYPDGRTVVVWENYSPLGNTVEMEIISASGISEIGPSPVNSDGGSASHWVPAVAVKPGAGYLVVWEDYRNGRADIYARLFNGSGVPLGSDFTLVPTPHDLASQFVPEVAYLGADGYVIGWVDQRAGQEIYIQQYDPNAGLVGGNLLISAGDLVSGNWGLDLTVMPSGRLFASWASFGAQNSIVSLKFDPGVVPLGLPVPQNMSLTGRRWAPSVSFSQLDRYSVAWTEFVDDDADIHFMIFDSAWTRLLTGELLVNDDLQGAVSDDPVVTPTSNWWNLVAFSDRRNDAGDIYIQALDNGGNLPSANMRINQDIGYSLQFEPAIASRGDRALVVWVDSRNVGGQSGQRIYGRLLSIWGNPISNEFMITAPDIILPKSEPAVALASDGRALVVWRDTRDGSSQVYGQWLLSDGGLDGPEFSISVPGSDLVNAQLSLVSDNQDRFFVGWLDVGTSEPQYKVRSYNLDKSPGDAFDWSSTIPSVPIAEADMAVSESGEIVLGWSGGSGEEAALYLATFTGSGTLLVAPLQITDNLLSTPISPSVSVDGEGYISYVWIDHRQGRPLAYFQVLTEGLTPVGINQPVSNEPVEYMANPNSTSRRGRAWFVWADPRTDGLNVIANTVLYLPTDVDDDDTSLPSDYTLSQNYPNPFNPSTTIGFTLPRQSYVSLVLFDILGRRVRQLVNDQLSAGKHEVTWDGRSETGQVAASGVYLYRLEAGEFSSERKMILLK
jgi:hypothetical protein